MENLKPCPFCGSEAKLLMSHKGKDIAVYIKCSKCIARTKGYYPDTHDEELAYNNLEQCIGYVIEKWNERVSCDYDGFDECK